MKTSTLQDIKQNKKALMKHAYKILKKNHRSRRKFTGDEDAWESIIIGDLAFDFNTFAWDYNDEFGDENIMVTVYPVEYDDDGEVGYANTSEWVRLLVKDMKNNRIVEDWKVNA
jgi:hypothetical protein